MQKKQVVFDLDGTLCSITAGGEEYKNAEPRQDVINKLNSLYNDGWLVVISTARGMCSFNGDAVKSDFTYRELTERWLEKYKVKYHELRFGKPAAVYYVDDKSISPEMFLATTL